MRKRAKAPPESDRLTADVFQLMGAVRDRLDVLGALGPAKGKRREAARPATIPRADLSPADPDHDVTVAKGWGERPSRRRS